MAAVAVAAGIPPDTAGGRTRMPQNTVTPHC